MLLSPLHYFVPVVWLQAYKTLVAKEGTEGALPGVGLTEDQLFFVGFARVSIKASYPFRQCLRLEIPETFCAFVPNLKTHW